MFTYIPNICQLSKLPLSSWLWQLGCILLGEPASLKALLTLFCKKNDYSLFTYTKNVFLYKCYIVFQVPYKGSYTYTLWSKAVSAKMNYKR